MARRNEDSDESPIMASRHCTLVLSEQILLPTGDALLTFVLKFMKAQPRRSDKKERSLEPSSRLKPFLLFNCPLRRTKESYCANSSLIMRCYSAEDTPV